MKNLIKFSLIGALAVFSLAQAADIDTVTVTPAQLSALQSHRYPMEASEFGKFKREYQLSNGMVLALSNTGHIMYAQLNDQPRERIVATSTNTFSSTRSGLKMHLNVWNTDAVSGEVYIPVARSVAQVGSASPSYVVVALR